MDTGLAYLRTEPLVSYEERKVAKQKKDAAGNGKEAAATPDPPASPGPGVAADSMMAGVVPGARKKEEDAKLLPVTPFGRYAKVLLSSGEFLYID